MARTRQDVMSLRNRQAIAAIIEHMDNAIEDAARFTTFESFASDRIARNSVAMELIQISETGKIISTAFMKKYSDIPWREIRELRNRLVHEYDQIEWDIVFTTVKDDLPIYRRILAALRLDIPDALKQQNGNVFDKANTL